jgi:hypothetical protein
MIIAEYMVRIHVPEGSTSPQVEALLKTLEFAVESEIKSDLESVFGASVPFWVTVGRR